MTIKNIKDDGYYTQVAQIKNTIKLITYLIVSYFCIFSYISILYFYTQEQLPFYFSVWWSSSSLIMLSLFLLVQLYLKKQKNHLNFTHPCLQGICLILGLLVALGICLIYFYLPATNPTFTPDNALVLSALLLIVTQAFGLTYLTQHLSYFCLNFIPSILPYLYLAFSNQETLNPILSLTINCALIVILVCANITSKIYRRITILNVKNKHLLHQTAQQVDWTNQLCQQLQTEISKSKNIEQQLQFNNQLLEQKVKDRTQDIENINTNLSNQQQNLLLAQEIAGLKQWEWDIPNRTITQSNSKNEVFNKSSKLHHQQLINMIHPDDLPLFRKRIGQHLRGQSERYEVSYRLKSNHTEWMWVHDIGRVTKRDAKNRPLLMLGIRRDIHAERLAQEQTALSNSVFEQADEGIFILDQNFRYLKINPYYSTITGFKPEKIIGRKLFEKTRENQPEYHNKFNNILSQLCRDGEYHGELTLSFQAGLDIPLWVRIQSVKTSKNQITHYIGMVSDLTEQKYQEQRLSYLENYEPLTDLPNRYYFNYLIHQYILNTQEHKKFGLLRINVDRFRPLNEFLSNNGGDELLRQIAYRLRVHSSEALFISHLGGDDFALIFDQATKKTNISSKCQEILQSFNEPFFIFGQEYYISVSIGVAMYPDQGRQIDDLFTSAEVALHEAKNIGGNTYQYYKKDEMTIHPLQEVSLERDLRLAIRNRALTLHYQPKIDLTTNKTTGFEALIRWNHPIKGLIPPSVFLNVAEQSSLISEIGNFVIHESIQQIKAWKNLGFNDIRISINVVAQQLRRGQLLDHIDQALTEFGLSGESLELEITETSLIENSLNIKNLLAEIHNRKIQIALDDFGTGYSSLSYLAEFPIDTLKIDRSFISKIGTGQSEEIINAMIAMAKALQMQVVAEGIETENQLNYLKNLQCDIGQGFYFSQALSSAQATEYLKNN